ncbi:MAG: hypothetical protein F6J93_16915 [Oscillatoria sp. SIO1A7]|nr:hypothetical protein [Oscillatoria sp. SIO1A7]
MFFIFGILERYREYRGRDPGRRGDSIPETAFALLEKIIVLECFAQETYAAHRSRQKGGL